MSKNKRYIGLSSALLFSVLSAQACFADLDPAYSKVKIQSVKLMKRISEGNVRIYDLGKNSDGSTRYNIGFSGKLECDYPKALLKDENGNEIKISKQAGNVLEFADNMGWKLNVDAVGVPSFYVVNYKLNVDNSCPSLIGSMPELKVELDATVDSDGSRYLMVTNVSSKAIEAVNVQTKTAKGRSDEVIVDTLGFKTIDAGDTGRIKLSPAASTCNEDSKIDEKTLKLIIEYKSGAETTKDKFEFEVVYSCNWSQEKEFASQLLSAKTVAREEGKNAANQKVLEAVAAINNKLEKLTHSVNSLGDKSSKDEINAALGAIENAKDDLLIKDAQATLGISGQFDALAAKVDLLAQGIAYKEQLKNSEGNSKVTNALITIREETDRLKAIVNTLSKESTKAEREAVIGKIASAKENPAITEAQEVLGAFDQFDALTNQVKVFGLLKSMDEMKLCWEEIKEGMTDNM